MIFLEVEYNNKRDVRCTDLSTPIKVPESLSKLHRLKTLDISHNSKLKKLPKCLAQCRSMDKLVLDNSSITYPPSNVCSEGTEATMKFLCKGKSVCLDQTLFWCSPILAQKRKNVHLFSFSLSRFDKCHKTSRIFTRTRQDILPVPFLELQFEVKMALFALGWPPQPLKKPSLKVKRDIIPSK